MNEQTRKKWITEGIALAAIPAFCYLITYLYESGYNRIIGLPDDFINIDLVSVLGALAAMSIVLFFAYNLIVLSEALVKAPHNLRLPLTRLSLASLYTLFIAGLFLHTDLTKHYIITLAVPILALFVFIDFILPLIFHRSVKGFLNKVSQAEANRQEGLKKTPNYLGNFIGQLPGGTFTYFFILMFMLLGSYHIGTSSALTKDDFYKINGKDEVVVKILPNSIIGAKVKENRLTKEFSVYPVNNPNQPLQLSKYDGPKIIITK